QQRQSTSKGRDGRGEKGEESGCQRGEEGIPPISCIFVFFPLSFSFVFPLPPYPFSSLPSPFPLHTSLFSFSFRSSFSSPLFPLRPSSLPSAPLIPKRRREEKKENRQIFREEELR